MRKTYFRALGALILLTTLLLCLQYGLGILESIILIAVGYASLYLIYHYAKLNLQDIGLGKNQLKKGVRWSVAILLVIAVGMLAVFFISPDLFKDDRYEQGLGPALLTALLILPIRTILLEELLFRGMWWGLICKLKNEHWATIVSSAVFGLWHILPSRTISPREVPFTDLILGTPIIIGGIVLATFIAGVVFSELRRRSGSLLPAIVAHWSFNGIGLILSALV